MKSAIILLSVIGLVNQPLTDVQLVKKLDRKTTSRQASDINYVEKMIRKYPKSAVPYYFATQFYLQEYELEKTTKTQYGILSKSLSYGAKVKKRLNNENKDLLPYQGLLDTLQVSSQRYLAVLKERGDTVRMRNLKLKYERVFGADKHTEVIMEKEVGQLEFRPETKFFNGQYFGMPAGNESIEVLDQSAEAEMLRLINTDRTKMNMQPLIMDLNLVRAARYHATDMATQNYFNHQSYDSLNGKLVLVGSTFPRIRIFYTTSFVNSENIAAGSSTAKDTYHQWYTSKGHYDNMFNSASKKVGIAMAYSPNSTFGYYWVFCSAL